MTELQKRQIELQLAEYEQAIEDALAWYAEWKSRQSVFRCRREAKPTGLPPCTPP